MWVLLALVVLGLTLAIWQPIELETLPAWGERIGTAWWFLLLVMLTMALLFTFGLPGSLGLWLIAPFNHPLLSTALFVIASTAGALGAYRFARRLGSDWRPSGPSGASGGSGGVVEALEKRSDLLTQLAMRILPGFPHSVVNFAGGVLSLPLKTFIIATVVGLGIKWGFTPTPSMASPARQSKARTSSPSAPCCHCSC